MVLVQGTKLIVILLLHLLNKICLGYDAISIYFKLAVFRTKLSNVGPLGKCEKMQGSGGMK